ncbi:TIGR03620 family F420-dependent LLM class oxidoreductase [Actinoplanes sp. CA-131856]
MKQAGLWSMKFRDVAELEKLGWDTFWTPGLDGSGALGTVARLLAAAPASTVATGVLNIWGQTRRKLSDFYAAHADRLLVGLGIGNAAGAAARGQDYGNPITSMSRYLDQLEIPAERLLLGALGPKMVDLAVTRTAGWHPFLVTPSYVAKERARVGQGPLIAPHQAVVVGLPPAESRALARAQVGMFIGFPAYRNNLRRLGFTDDDLVPGGSDRLIDALVAHGSTSDIADRVRSHLDAGADHVALHVLGSQTPTFASVLKEN